jgi:hypothetical protein
LSGATGAATQAANARKGTRIRICSAYLLAILPIVTRIMALSQKKSLKFPITLSRKAQ